MNTPTIPPLPVDSHRILVVDDNPAIHDDFRKILGPEATGTEFDLDDADFFGSATPSPNRIHFELDFASQGREALDRVIAADIAQRRYSVVFMDVRMPPGWDGIETTARIWEADPDLQVVLCTAFSDYSWDQMVARLGNTDRLLILKKPFDIIEVVQCAHALSGKWSLLQQARRHAGLLETAVKERTSDLEIANALLKSEIAERQRTEDALRFTQFSVDNSSDSMFWVAPNTGLLYVNSATCRTLGYSIRELHTMSVLDIIPELRETEWQPLWESLRSSGHRTFEAVQLSKSGRRIPVELTVTFFTYGGQELLCASARDITVRQRILAELSATRDVALESVRLKGQFLANMSHEIRTPMNGVIGMSELLLHTNLDRDQRHYIDTIRTSADLLLDIINDILDTSKIESGKVVFETHDFDLGEIVDGTLDIIGGVARKKNLELAGNLAADVFPHLLGDSGRLRQVLTNIVGNAVKFTESGEVILTVSALSQTKTHTELRFEVRDTGIGISPAACKHIFEPFTQADGSEARKYGGTGLGLTICRQIVEALGGKIGVESNPGQGSTFWFQLKFEKQSSPAATVAPQIPSPANLRVLVVDDNATNREILVLQLTHLQMRPVSAASGTEALAVLRQETAADPFQLAVLDMRMPEMDGLDLARAIKADPAISKTRLILLSSLGDKLTESALQQAGIDDCLAKPIKQHCLHRAVAALSGCKVPPVSVPPAASDPHPAPQSSLRILLAEDNRVNQQVALLQLKHLGYTADVVADGVEAIKALEQVPYDVILMDCQMPTMDGYAATREIRRTCPRPVRIIAMTANAMDGDRQKCLAAGMDDYISKPVKPADLSRLLAECETANPPAQAVTKDPVNMVRLLEITGGQPEMFRQLSHDYLEQAEEILALIALAIERRSAADIHQLAHKLGGSSASCGMDAIIRPLARLEQLGSSMALEQALELLQEVTIQLSRIRRFLTRHLQSGTPIDPTPL